MPVPVQIAYKPIGKPEIGVNNYQGFHPGKTELLPKGWNGNNAKPLESDVRVEHDVEIVVRDGCRLCYGKKYSALSMLPMTVWQCCVKKEDLSGIEKFEGLDPQKWCPRGYAIISVDSRGTGNSDGQIPIMGSQDAEDAYDVIEALAKKPWCNGKVGMAGNSALAIIQWHTAQLQPPSLAAIAPWEGSGDLFREQFCRGGVFSMSNFDLITREIIKGNSGVEDFAEMYRRSPVANAYWNDKRADMTKIKCPVFISGSDFSSIHTMGAVRGYMEVPHDKKWIRWSSHQEWYELYCDDHADAELHEYFDLFLKGIPTDFEKKTPKVRWSALQFGDRPAIDNIPYPDFPIPNTDYKTFYLYNNTLNSTPSSTTSTLSYNSEDAASFAEFTHTFPTKTRLIGLPKAVLHMSCPTHNDLNVFIHLRKLSTTGEPLLHLCFPFSAAPVNSISEIPAHQRQSTNLHTGSVGVLRASHRAFDPKRSIHPNFPFHPHEKEEKIKPGDVVELEIGIWAMGVDFDDGESLSVQIGGQFPSIAEYKAWSEPRPEWERNKGEHRIHVGGEEWKSRIILPFVPI
ncbi:hypothetical protein CB0940_08213 [Cercospora beticola]|uniref:Xaa-Pro dipeptidyl-peptidase C-terminal domain-containing protein n=1 Tax=Cercospora beticola TaxID=122368 RepID=A0A2G5HPU4_CERBT|nr:hypothetical protein CB0940_08213 [Cercospora beticola]PIA94273.1 hypothetical protein CB0940_08213 [Cercospora beticola]WPB04781.1 hypothetical protein RHO25_009428 [Cercospora beticola]